MAIDPEDISFSGMAGMNSGSQRGRVVEAGHFAFLQVHVGGIEIEPFVP